jgi:hypothetical protein
MNKKEKIMEHKCVLYGLLVKSQVGINKNSENGEKRSTNQVCD